MLTYFFLFCGSQLYAKETIQAYFSNDSLNGVKLSDAYETHNMGLIYSNSDHYLKLDLGLVSPDMYVYRNEYRKANRSFAELITLEIGEIGLNDGRLRFYAQTKIAGDFGVDKLQDFAHRILSLQQVNGINELIRMPEKIWIGVGARREFDLDLLNIPDIKFHYDGFVGSDTTFFSGRITKEFHHPLFTYDISASGRFVVYDEVVSAPPINSTERTIIPGLAFGIRYDAGPYSVFLRDSFSLPSIKDDNDLFGLLSVGVLYHF